VAPICWRDPSRCLIALSRTARGSPGRMSIRARPERVRVSRAAKRRLMRRVLSWSRVAGSRSSVAIHGAGKRFSPAYVFPLSISVRLSSSSLEKHSRLTRGVRRSWVADYMILSSSALRKLSSCRRALFSASAFLSSVTSIRMPEWTVPPGTFMGLDWARNHRIP